jgi:hypothetical protein
MAFAAETIPKELIIALKEKRCSIFAGAGLSISSGLPSWKDLIKELIEQVEALPYDTKKDVEEYTSLVEDPSKYLMLAQDIKSSLGKIFYDYMGKRFTDQSIKPSKNHELLLDLPSNFILTTNYDNLIEKAFVQKYLDIPATLIYSQSKDIAYKLWNREFFVLKVHGDVRINKEQLIMTENDYREILFNSPGFQSALQVIFSTNTILFLGSSFSDPDFILLMRFLHTAYHGGGPTHFMIVNQEQSLNVEARRHMLDFNLHTIPYNPDNNHLELTEFLEHLTASVK